ncbi:MAG: sugar phosphate isomerase/epimerase family protein [Bryobacterales bacterium]|nr:sugar phosphate isomerase/epimerase [Bryobacteraceae bacterium]MDW8129870.1 sugar phosphate isomerase/epimerase family protein [Bryobacterales bacterium]
MTRALSTHLFVNYRLTTALLDKIQKAGIPAVEIFCARQHLDYRNRAQITELAHWFRDSELRFHALHSPIYSDDAWGRSGPHAILNIAEPSKTRRIQTVDEIKRAIEIAESAPFRYLIQHLGLPEEEYDERKVEAAFSSLDELSVFARQRGVEILLENIPNGLSTADRLVTFFELTHLRLGVCFDVGHAHLGEGVEEAFRKLKDRIRSTHLHDNDGREDAHLMPFASTGGTVDWARTVSLLRSCGDELPLLLEVRESPEIRNPLEAVQQVFERLERF